MLYEMKNIIFNHGMYLVVHTVGSLCALLGPWMWPLNSKIPTIPTMTWVHWIWLSHLFQKRETSGKLWVF